MAETIFVLIALIIPYGILAKTDIGLSKSNGIKFSNKSYPLIPNETVINKNVKKRLTLEVDDENFPYSEHEEPKNVSTRPNYTINGQLIYPKTKEDLLDFVPTKLYTQVRGKHTVKRVPRKYAVEEATTDEEKENANRLREVVTNKKTNTIYTEEGYEDSAYDHAGHIRDADFKEKYGRQLKNEYDEKGEGIYPAQTNRGNSDDVINEETRSRLSVQKKKNDNINPERVVIDGIKNLEKDLTNEYQKTEKDVNVYNDRISRIPASEESYEDANYKKNDDYDDEDYDESSEQSDEKRNSSSNSSEESDTQQVRNSNADTSKQSSTENTSSEKYTEDSRSGEDSRRSTENASYKSMEMIIEGNNDYRPYRYPSSASVEEYNQSTDRNEESETSSLSEEMSTTKSHPKEPKHFKNYRPDTETLNYKDIKPPTATTQYTLMDYTMQPTINPDVLWENFKRRQNQRGSKKPEIKKTKNNEQEESIPDSSSNEQPHFESLIATPASVEPLTMRPYYRSEIPYVETETSTLAKQAETSATKRYRIKPEQTRKPTISSYTIQESTTPQTSFTTYSTSTSTEKKTEFDHNPYLSPYAKQFDRKLKRYHPISRERTDSDEAKDESQHHKYKSPTRNDESEEESSESFEKKRRVKKKIHPKIQRKPKKYKKEKLASYEVTNSKSSKYKNRKKPQKIVRYRKPILGIDGSYDPILNAYIFPKVINDHLYAQKKFYPPPPSEIKRSYSLYDIPIIQSGILPQKFYPTGKTIIRFKRSLMPFDNMDLEKDTFQNKTNKSNKIITHRESNKNSQSSRTPRKAPIPSSLPINIVKSVIDKEIKIRFPADNDTSLKDNKNLSLSTDPVSVEVPEFDEELIDKEEYETSDYVNVNEEKVDYEKYPFYNSEFAKVDPTLKYILNPNYVPKKTFGGMEFYNSRILECKDVEPDLSNVLPREEEPTTTRGYNENLPRLKELGDKLDCFKTKYFDPNPLDNPLFMEKRIDTVEVPPVMNPMEFSSRITDWSNERAEYARSLLSKTPEYETDETRKLKKIRIKSKPEYIHKKPYKQKITSGKKETNKSKRKNIENKEALVPLRLYGNQVYDDVMGTITKSQSKPKKKRSNPRKRTREKKESSNKTNYSEKLSEESSDEVNAVKLRFVPNSYKLHHSSKLEVNDSIPVLDLPSVHPPKKIRVIKGGPYLSVNISKPKGTKLRINYRAIPNYKKYQHNHNIHKRSTKDSDENENRDDTLRLNVNKPNLNQTKNESRNQNVSKKPSVKKKNTSKKDSGRYGLFSKNSSTKGDTDRRRNEPRYNPIEEPNSNYEVTKGSLKIIVPNVTTLPPDFHTPAGTVILINHDVTPQNSYTLIPITNESTTKPKAYPKIELFENKPKSIDDSDELKKINKRYEVHEIINEDGSKQNLTSQPEQKSDSKEYYSESAEESTESHNKVKSKTPEPDYDYGSSKENSRENSREQSREYSSNEETSPEETYSRSKHDSNENDSSETEQEEDEQPFTRYKSRPYSPPQYYYDPKYADLGPRIDKPAFYHPRFKSPEYERRKLKKNIRDTSAESYESNESSEPTSWDRNDESESKHFVHTIKRYEYPWEKRDRLAKEKRRRKYKYHSNEDNEEDNDDEDPASSENFFSYFPWNVKIFDIPRPKKTYKQKILYDSDGDTSNVSPVTSKPKLKPKVSVSKVNRTIVEIENNPILQTQEKTRLTLETNRPLKTKTNVTNLSLNYEKNPRQVTNKKRNIIPLTERPNKKIIPTPELDLSSTINPPTAFMSQYSNIEILKTNPRIKSKNINNGT